jgi:hypothetical protein
VLESVVKSQFIPGHLVISSLRNVLASRVFNDLQTLFPSASLQSEVTPCFSFASALVCNSRKSAHFPPFVFLHLHTLFHSFTKSDSPSLLFSVACALFAKNGGYTPASRHFRILLASDTISRRGWLAVHITRCAFRLPKPPIALSTSMRSLDEISPAV